MLVHYLESFDFDVDNKVLQPSAAQPDKLFFVMVMADWCGHCKHAKPEVLKAAKDLENNDKVLICFVNITGETKEEKECKDVAPKFFDGFRGFPHLCIYKGGKEVAKQDSRKSEDIVKAIRNLMN